MHNHDVLLTEAVSAVYHSLVTFWMGSSPSTFYQLYCIMAVLLLVIRWMSYKKQKMHYYMFDFCYAVNGLLVMHLLFWPKSSLMYKVGFKHCNCNIA